MKTVIQTIEVAPSMPTNPLGEYTHLLRVHVRHDDEANDGTRRSPIYLAYCRKDNTLAQITEDGAMEFITAAAFKNAETSRPTT